MLSVIGLKLSELVFSQNWRLYVWELDITCLSTAVVQSLAIKSHVNKRAKECIEILRQRNIKKATQY